MTRLACSCHVDGEERGDDDNPHTVYDYQPTRKRDGPMRVLSGYKGYLQGDCWKGFAAICGPAGAKKAACVAHARRKFFDAQTTDEARALMALQFIRALYDVEAQGRFMTAEARGALRRRESKPIFEQFGQWLRATRSTVLPKSPMGQAIGYTLSHWPDLKRYLEDGVIDIDNNEAERALRPIAIGRRNWTCSPIFAMCSTESRRLARRPISPQQGGRLSSLVR